MALPPGHDRPTPRTSMATVIEPEGTGKIVKRKRRPARQQVKPGQIAKVRSARCSDMRRLTAPAEAARAIWSDLCVLASWQTDADGSQTTSGASKGDADALPTSCRYHKVRLLVLRHPASAANRCIRFALRIDQS